MTTYTLMRLHCLSAFTISVIVSGVLLFCLFPPSEMKAGHDDIAMLLYLFIMVFTPLWLIIYSISKAFIDKRR